MKQRTAFIGAILSLIPLGQPFFMKTGLSLSTTGLMLLVPKKVTAESAYFYDRQGLKEWKNNNFSGAVKNYTKAIELDPYNSRLYGKRGNAYYQLGNFYAAISDYNKTLNMDPYDQKIWTFRGFAKEKIGDIKGACNDWRKASSMGEEFAAEMLERFCKYD